MTESSLLQLKSAEEMGPEERRTTCSLCLVQFARYTCPRCNVHYCSLNCYKSERHAQCSEDFYRECFMSELQSQEISSAEKGKMIEILKRAAEEKESEDEEREREREREDGCSSLEERLAGVDLDSESSETLWRRLTRSEQEQFHNAVSSGHISSLIPLCTPWWRVTRPAVVAVEESGGPNPNPVPEVLPNLPPLHTLLKGGKASPLVCYSVLNVLYAYAFTVRLYNGEHHDLSLESAQTVLKVSSCLSDGASYAMAGEAITHAVTTVQQSRELAAGVCGGSGGAGAGEMALSVMEDISCILCGPQPVCHCTAPQALSDLHCLLSSAAALLHSVKGSRNDYQSLKRACKKVYFLIVWALQNIDNLKSLARVVDIEHETSVSSWRAASAHSQQQHNSPASSKLITEIS